MAKIADDEGLRNVLDAHGGLDYWRSLSAIDLEYSAWGFLFTAKRISPLRHAHLTISTQEPDVVLHDYPVPGQSAVLHGAELVEIRDAAGSVLQTRTNPREAFGHWRRLFRWDAMDFAYFSNYAMWNYLTLPFLLLHPAVTVEASENAAPLGVTRLKVCFPTTLPTHSPTQELYFDQSGRLFIVEQRGTIRILEQIRLLEVPFLDIKDRVLFKGEQGLLGLAFHPEYRRKGNFFVNYTRKDDGAIVIEEHHQSD